MTYEYNGDARNHLDPQATQIRVQGFIEDYDYILKKNPYEEYNFSFAPATPQDHHRLYENIEKVISDVEIGFGPYSSVTPKVKYQITNGFTQCSQLFKPKLNCEIPFPEWMHGKEASLNLYLRNGPDGSIYLQCSYIDFMDPFNGFEEIDNKIKAIRDSYDPEVDYDF